MAQRNLNNPRQKSFIILFPPQVLLHILKIYYCIYINTNCFRTKKNNYSKPIFKKMKIYKITEILK